MKDLIIPVNNEALSRALIAVVGEENTKMVVEAYKLTDQAMVFGYEKSQNEEAEARKKMAEDYVAALQRAERRDTKSSFDDGFEEGAAFARGSEDQSAYDDGYVDGVADARAWPKYADEQLERLCSADEYDEANVSDSGDVNAYLEAN